MDSKGSCKLNEVLLRRILNVFQQMLKSVINFGLKLIEPGKAVFKSIYRMVLLLEVDSLSIITVLLKEHTNEVLNSEGIQAA